MAYQRNPLRGPGSNQYGDKQPLPASPFEQKFKKQRSEMLRGAVDGLATEETELPFIDASHFYNAQSGLSAKEWEKEFVDAATSFASGKLGAQGKLFGLMQYIPLGAAIPDHTIATLGPKLKQEGLFLYDHPEKVDDDVAAVVAAFDRAMYTRLYTDAYREETRVLTAIQSSEEIIGKIRHISAYLGEKNQDPKFLESVINDAREKVTELEDLAIGDTRERSHVKANLRMLKKENETVGSDHKRMKERAYVTENHALTIDKQIRGEYVRRAPFWMEAVHNRSFFALKTGNYPSIRQHLEEISTIAQKSFEYANSLPVREGTARKRQLKRLQRAVHNTQQAMLPYANEGDERFDPPVEAEHFLAELRIAILS